MKTLVALQQNMREFDPECERHFPILVIKAVDPGCTLELQIEDAATGEVTRLTSRDDPKKDLEVFEKAVLTAFRKAWERAESNAEND